ncbi:transcriptional regulator of NAD metabolism [Peribacillus deserti]|uniref:Transcriptional regulator of NAD metabolism n=1 Tax=Peribacillus deserti TaxID=673318 RepID=A0ABS2QFH3_9BACI|nr:transcription repressor NadR [Peribacillus deserti]MBM7691907.1 transcriptional regulator of NAD metabolism [Peribacillus deserti]
MKEEKKLLGESRRNRLLDLLKESNAPITGSELARLTNVSRQIIVGDITLLKARNEPIIATSQGYLFLHTPASPALSERTIACQHSPGQAKEELYILVDLGVTVKDVKVEHPVYGDLTASIMVSNRHEVDQFLEKIKQTNAAYLSELTEGIHLHTISASNENTLNQAVAALKDAGYLIH